jgi:T5SS/PEP-CTERM-associated repeat protein/autotransporter-associated beta strand protein
MSRSWATRSVSFWFALLATISFAGRLPSACAAITPTGDVEPSNPSSWTTSTTAYIGNTSSGTLTVDLGSKLSSYSGCVACGTSTTGVVIVDGTGSAWTNYFLFVGYGKSSVGTLSISNGAAVSSLDSGDIGYNPSSAGTVSVSGDGSQWNIGGGLSVGNSGSGTLNVLNGGTVNSSGPAAQVGYNLGSTGAVKVDGTSSTWTNSGDLLVGCYGSGSLTIANGGNVTVSGTTYLARYPGSTGVINFGSGGGTLTSASIYASPTQLTGTGTINAHGLVSDANLVFDSGASTAVTLSQPGQDVTVNLDMSNSKTAGDLGVGYNGNGFLTIRNGVTVYSSGGYLGYNSGSAGTATVDGVDSTWTCSGTLYVGDNGSGTLNISNGATVAASGKTYVGYSCGAGMIDFVASGGTLTTGELWASPSQLAGTGTINARGLVTDTNVMFDGSDPSHAANQIVPGFGSVTVNLDMSNSTTAGNLGVGYNGNGSLTIRNGVTVYSTGGYLGYNSGSAGTATVDGTGSAWANRNDLYVGYAGAGRLSITNGGVVSSDDGYLGFNAGSTGMAVASGTGSKWNLSEDLYVGNSGCGTLSVTSGGTVNCSGFGVYVGNNAGATGIVTVDGAGSACQFSGAGLFLSSYGNAVLNITNGGAVNSFDGFVGGYSGSTAVAAVDGPGSNWTAANVYVGWTAKGTLEITNGGAVSNGDCTVGYSSGSMGSVTVDGTGSTWTNTGTIYVGYNSNSNGTLNITNGGAVLANAIVGGSTSTSTMAVYFDGGVLRPYNASNSNWISKGAGTANVYIQKGGATFDTGSYKMGIPITLQHSGDSSIDGGVTKLGAGTLTLGGTNTYTGDTIIGAGLLVLASEGSILMDINSSGPYGKFLGTGSLDLEGVLNLNLSGVTSTPDTWQLVAPTLASTTYGSSFAIETSTGGVFSGTGGVLSCINGAQEWTFTESTGVLAVVSVPEPSTLALLAIGAVSLLAYAWRRRRV